jgi:hypothetical protein
MKRIAAKSTRSIASKRQQRAFPSPVSGTEGWKFYLASSPEVTVDSDHLDAVVGFLRLLSVEVPEAELPTVLLLKAPKADPNTRPTMLLDTALEWFRKHHGEPGLFDSGAVTSGHRLLVLTSKFRDAVREARSRGETPQSDRDSWAGFLAAVADGSGEMSEGFLGACDSGIVDSVGAGIKADSPVVGDVALATVTLPRLLSATEARLAESLASIAITPTTAKSTLPAKLKELETTLRKLQDPIRAELRKFIDEINELPADQRTMGSLVANKQFTSTLQRLLSTVGERLCCPSCGQPGTLRCMKGNSPTGVFAFAHSQGDKRSGHGGWSRLPTLTIAQYQTET